MGHYLSELDEETYNKHYPPPKRYFDVYFLNPEKGVWELSKYTCFPQELPVALKERDSLSSFGYETMVLESRNKI